MNKRIIIVCGHYGSGKTNIALNLAYSLKKAGENIAIADLDIVNPYFRTKDSAAALAAAGIRLISSAYAGSNVDIPALPQDMYAITHDKNMKCVLDIGGDDRGALALGRLAPDILAENNFENLLVINRFRPLTRDAESVDEIRREIEFAGGIPFTGIVNNSNLGRETTAEDIAASEAYAREVSALCGLPIVMTSVDSKLFDLVKDKVTAPFALQLQQQISLE